MAQAASLWVRLGLSDKDFSDGLKRTENQIQRFGNRLSTLGNRITTGISLPFLAAGAAAVKLSADMETTTVAFTTLLGSTEKAQKQLTALKDFAARTPFQFTELTDASRRMMAMGFAAEQVIPTMRILGDAVGALGVGREGLNNIILALGQMQMKGKVSAEEMTRQLGQYVNAWQYLADYLETDVATAMDQAKKGMISGAAGVKAVLQGLANDPKFKDGMEKQMTTLNGLWSNFLDNLKFGLADLGNQIVNSTNLKEIFSSITQGIKDFMTWFAQLDPWLRNAIVQIALLTAALGPLLIIVGKVSVGFSALIGVLRLLPGSALITTIKSIGTALLWMTEGAGSAKIAIGLLAESFTPFLVGGAIFVGLTALTALFLDIKKNADLARKSAKDFTDSLNIDKAIELNDKQIKALQNQKKVWEDSLRLGMPTSTPFTQNEQKQLDELLKRREALSKRKGELMNPSAKTESNLAEEYKKLFDSLSGTSIPDADKAKERARIEAQARIDVMYDGMKKELAAVDENYRQQLEKAQEFGADTTDITTKYMRDRANVMLEYWQKEQEEEKKQNEYLQRLWEENYPWKSALQKATEDWENWSQHVRDIATATAQGMQESFSDFFTDSIKGQIDDLGDYFQSFADSVIRAWSDAMSKMLTSKIMNSSFGTWFGGSFDGRANGGSVVGGKTYVVGERGPELFTPSSNGTITPNHALGGANVTVQVVNPPGIPLKAKTTQPKFDGKQYVVSVMLEAINNNTGGVRDALGTVRG